LLARLTAALAAQADPRVEVGRSRTAVVTFEADTGAIMLRSRVIQALEVAVGMDGQRVVTPIP
jgi:hypothetical protein